MTGCFVLIITEIPMFPLGAQANLPVEIRVQVGSLKRKRPSKWTSAKSTSNPLT